MESRAQTDNRPVHIINIDIQDNHEEATMGAFLICDLVAMVYSISLVIRGKFKNFIKIDFYLYLVNQHR